MKLQNYYCPDELKTAITRLVDYYNNKRYHESLDYLTPADVYLGKGEKILTIRKQIKKDLIFGTNATILVTNEINSMLNSQTRILFECYKRKIIL